MKLRGKIRALTATAGAAGVIGGSMLTAGVASAVPYHGTVALSAKVTPDVTYHCSGNVCAGVISNNNGVVTIRAYPPNFTFTGHFELQTPNHRTFNSIETTWHAGGTGNYFNNINGGNGTYCVTAWEAVTGGWSNIGSVCFSN